MPKSPPLGGRPLLQLRKCVASSVPLKRVEHGTLRGRISELVQLFGAPCKQDRKKDRTGQSEMVEVHPKRGAVLDLYNQGHGTRKISKLLNVPQKTIYDTNRGFKELGTTSDRPGRG
ncbi:hypothetical protein ANCDUO_12955 [Ancylostoma duodenale]|uniref:Uncharacterized protein n=1 Tax=Ancylostoma duodenale TaxID=51022 RepID=A0A0C2GIH2_9BILA|nr:hypothetical protein ANCDUO_12955 [Ancylostoma duodenale]